MYDKEALIFWRILMPNEDIALITLHNAIVRRNGKDILSIDDFNLEQGESIALIGPNGAGKTTTFYMTVGLRASLLLLI